MSDIANIHLPDDQTYNIKDKKARAHLIYSVIGTQTEQTNLWTGDLDIDELYDGITIIYYLPTQSLQNVTLELSLNNRSTGPINVYYSGEQRMGGQYSAGCCITLTYWSAGSISIDGSIVTDDRWTHGGEGGSMVIQVSKRVIGSASFGDSTISADDITSWNAGRMPVYSVNADGLLVIDAGELPSLMYTERNIPSVDITDVEVVTDVVN